MLSNILGGQNPPINDVAQQSIAAGANGVDAAGGNTALNTLLGLTNPQGTQPVNAQQLSGALKYLSAQHQAAQLASQQQQVQKTEYDRMMQMQAMGGSDDGVSDSASTAAAAADSESANAGEDGSPGSGSDAGDAGDGDGAYAGGGLVNYARGGQVIELAGGGKVAIGMGGGLDDLIPTTIDGRRAAALSDGEFVMPADVVSMLGDGSSNQGSRRLYDLIKQIREAKTGTSEQAGPLPVARILDRAL